ncbi:subclass B3 metallo-beta-lactamase [Arenimonas sp. MALMAid1274]|uniref:subclass B3 metallo-beta-lactamase n=1 Tax=Arenimonas sp. MALMAid1274 TaxID=3411630 RepID=UPI003B9EF188
MPSNAVLLMLLLATAPSDLRPIDCEACAGWNAPQAPFRLHGNSYYVGTRGLSAVLVATDQGLVLIDGGLPQSAPVIAANIASLGYRLSDLRWILISHAHYDHAGGIAALQRLSGAKVAATAHAAAALRAGDVPADDPQVGFGRAANAFPPVTDVVELEDGALIRVGGTTLTMHATPGHTPGGSTWSWRSCEGEDCRNLVYADSLTAVSAPGFRFSDAPALLAQFEATFTRVEALPCDLVVSAHPDATGLFNKLAVREGQGTGPALLDSASCRNYAAAGREWLKKRLAKEAGSTQ